MLVARALVIAISCVTGGALVGVTVAWRVAPFAVPVAILLGSAAGLALCPLGVLCL